MAEPRCMRTVGCRQADDSAILSPTLMRRCASKAVTFLYLRIKPGDASVPALRYTGTNRRTGQ